MSAVALALLQILLTTGACYFLWRLWRMYAARTAGDRGLLLIVAAGFLLRALLGQALYWISWLHLPVLRSLQRGAGYWFFALDAPVYLHNAGALLRGELHPFTLQTTYSSHTFVEVLALFIAIGGGAASIGLLLNGAAYLGTCILILKVGPSARLPRLVALLAVSFGPGSVLWSLQALKDTLLAFFVVALFAAFSSWQARWDGRPSRAVGRAALLFVLLYAVAGLRWYFAGIIWGVSALFFLLTALPSRRRFAAIASAAVVVVILAASVGVGGGGDMRPILWFFGEKFRQQVPSVTAISTYLADIRKGFEGTPGATTIGVGPRALPQPAAAASERQPEASNPIATAPVLTPAPALTTRALTPLPALRPTPAPAPAPVSESTPGTTAAAAPSASAALSPPVSAEEPSASEAPTAHQPELPQGTRERLITGAAATVLPRMVAQRLGLIDIRGGQGLWLFVEADTLAFDAVLLFALVWCTATLVRRRTRITPLFVFVALVLLATSIPMMYTVSNFGTLFRLRQMLYLLAALLPLTLAPVGEGSPVRETPRRTES